MIPSLIVFVPLLLSIAFLTLAERKVMGSTQRRIGPNIVGILGILQPIADGLKLLLKETIIGSFMSPVLFLVAPIISFIFSLIGWVVIPFYQGISIANIYLDLMLIIASSSLGVLGIILAGWAGNSKYALLGSLRTCAQMISYEVALSTIIATVALIPNSFNLSEIWYFQISIMFFIPLLPLTLIWFISALAETNRAPFDLPEAESELVSGFNTEHSSLPFAYFFLAEYGSIIFISTFTVILFFGFWIPLYIILPFILTTFIWVRASYPRLRYDQLMSLCWTSILPFSFAFFLLVASILSLNPFY
jgi:NADH:ubiquinone oxidoreductase subunit H